MRYAWPAGAATGIGSLPGVDAAEAQRVILGELPDLPHLVELPARGPGAELIGRGAGLLVELPVELYAARWRVASRPGRDLRRTRDLLERDLDQLTEQAADYRGTLKVQATGPWTLAAGIDLPVGGRMLRDPGAVRDLTESLAEGLRGYVASVAARVPGAEVLLQLDEPSLPAVLAGRVPTESGLGVLPAVEPSTATDALRTVLTAAGAPVVVHCCAPDVPLDLLRSAGAAAVALDLDLVTELDALGEAIDAGLGLFAGAVQPVQRGRGAVPSSGEPAGGPPSSGEPAGGPPSSAEVADRVRGLWRKLGFPVARLAEQVVVTPACGLAGTEPHKLRRVMSACRDAGRRLYDEAHA